MRTILAVLLLSAPAVAQPFPGPSPVDAATGRGAVDAAYVRQSMKWMDAEYTAFVNRTAWYFVHYDVAGREITVTPPGGRPFNAEVPHAVRRTAVQLTAFASATGVTFTGYSGGPIVTGSLPKVGDPYTGDMRAYPAGSTAVWSKLAPREKFAPPDGIVGVLVP
jgi:hypothetical protein